MGAGRGKNSKNYIEKYLHRIASVLLHESSISSLAKEIALKENKKHRTVHSALLGFIKRKGALISSIQDDFIPDIDTIRSTNSELPGPIVEKRLEKLAKENMTTVLIKDQGKETHRPATINRPQHASQSSDNKSDQKKVVDVRSITIDETAEMNPITFYDEVLLRDKRVEYECETYIRYKDDEDYYLKDYYSQHPGTILDQIVDKNSVIYLAKTFQDIADITCLECVRYPMSLRDTPRPFEEDGVPVIGGYSLLDYVLYPLLSETQEESVQNKRLWLLYEERPTLRLSIISKFSRSHNSRFEELRSALQK